MNTQTQKALKMAIVEINSYSAIYPEDKGLKEAIQACKEALDTKRVCENEAQPAQDSEQAPCEQPVAFNIHKKADELLKTQREINRKYGKAPPCQECENLKHDLDGYMEANKELINRKWQGLSDVELLELLVSKGGTTISYFEFARAIEQALKEKNANNN